MTITELVEKLENKEFQDYQTGNLFFPAYMYMYDIEKENEIDKEILNIRDSLYRPSNYLDVLLLDIFEEFLNYLSQEKFGRIGKLEYFLEHEIANSESVNKSLRQDAYNDKFLKFLEAKINDHLENASDYEVAFVFLKGFGRAYPYIRASRFMSNFEKYIDGYKLILFYPGKSREYYSLFGLLKDENLYRAIKLINE